MVGNLNNAPKRDRLLAGYGALDRPERQATIEFERLARWSYGAGWNWRTRQVGRAYTRQGGPLLELEQTCAAHPEFGLFDSLQKSALAE